MLILISWLCKGFTFCSFNLVQLQAKLNSYFQLRKWRGQMLGKIPQDLHDIIKLMLNTEPTVRPDPDQLSKVDLFICKNRF